MLLFLDFRMITTKWYFKIKRKACIENEIMCIILLAIKAIKKEKEWFYGSKD